VPRRRDRLRFNGIKKTSSYQCLRLHIGFGTSFA